MCSRYSSYSKLFYQCKPSPPYVITDNKKFVPLDSSIYFKPCTEMMLYPGLHQSLVEYVPEKQIDTTVQPVKSETYKRGCCGG